MGCTSGRPITGSTRNNDRGAVAIGLAGGRHYLAAADSGWHRLRALSLRISHWFSGLTAREGWLGAPATVLGAGLAHPDEV